MSPITIRATFAFAMPTNDSGPDCSAMTPTLMGGACDCDTTPLFCGLTTCGTMLHHCHRTYIGSTPYLGRPSPARRVRRDARARAGQRVRAAARVTAEVVPARGLDLRRGGTRRGRSRHRLLDGAAALRGLYRPRARGG